MVDDFCAVIDVLDVTGCELCVDVGAAVKWEFELVLGDDTAAEDEAPAVLRTINASDVGVKMVRRFEVELWFSVYVVAVVLDVGSAVVFYYVLKLVLIKKYVRCVQKEDVAPPSGFEAFVIDGSKASRFIGGEKLDAWVVFDKASYCFFRFWVRCF